MISLISLFGHSLIDVVVHIHLHSVFVCYVHLSFVRYVPATQLHHVHLSLLRWFPRFSSVTFSFTFRFCTRSRLFSRLRSLFLGWCSFIHVRCSGVDLFVSLFVHVVRCSIWTLLLIYYDSISYTFTCLNSFVRWFPRPCSCCSNLLFDSFDFIPHLIRMIPSLVVVLTLLVLVPSFPSRPVIRCPCHRFGDPQFHIHVTRWLRSFVRSTFPRSRYVPITTFGSGLLGWSRLHTSFDFTFVLSVFCPHTLGADLRWVTPLTFHRFCSFCSFDFSLPRFLRLMSRWYHYMGAIPSGVQFHVSLGLISSFQFLGDFTVEFVTFRCSRCSSK